MTLIPELERELARIAPPRRRRFSLRLTLGLPALLAAGTTAALAAGGVIPVGAPAKDPVTASDPHVGVGRVTSGSGRVLPVQAADPDGGPPWGMQLVTTSRGLGCLQAGRLVDGKIGVLGRDGAFHDDGRFHPFPAEGIGHPGTCAQLDGAHRLIASVAMGGIPDSASLGSECLAPQFTRGEPADKLCDPRSIRLLFYGTLGPQAQSIVVGGRVIPTAGDDGAYLIVRRIGHSGIGGVSVSPFPSNGPITEIRFKDGSSCKVGIAGPPKSCVNPGLTPPATPPVTSADVRAPLHVRLFHRGKHWHARISFRARVAITEAGDSYGLDMRTPPSASRRHAGFGMSTQRDIRAGEIVTFKLDWLAGHGRYHGVITYATGGNAFAAPNSRGALVSRVSFRLP